MARRKIPLAVLAVTIAGAAAMSATLVGSAVATPPKTSHANSVLDPAPSVFEHAAVPVHNAAQAPAARAFDITEPAVKTAVASNVVPTLPTGKPLSITTLASTVVDNDDHLVFLASKTVGIVVTDFAGTLVTTVEPTARITGMVYAAGQHTLYASVPDDHQIAQIATTGTPAETARLNLDPGSAPNSLAYVPGRLYFADTSQIDHLAYLDLATNAVTADALPSGLLVTSLANVPGQTGEIAIEDDWTTTTNLVDIGGAAPSLALSLPSVSTMSVPVFSPDAAWLVGDGGGAATVSNPSTTVIFDGSGMTRAGAATPTVFAFGGGFNSQNLGTPKLEMFSGTGTTPVREYTSSRVIPMHGLAFAADNQTLFVVTASDPGNPTDPQLELTVLANAATQVSTITVTEPHRAKLTTKVTPTGALTFPGGYDGVIRTLQVTRTDNAGVHALPAVTTTATGTFTITDTATPLGRALYTVTFAGDASHAPATGTGWTLREVPWDVNDDGYADLVVGSPGEDIGTVVDAGSFTVLYGHATGVSGTGSKEYDMNTAGVPGDAQAGAIFGWSQSTGDFNADGYPDVAVSAPGYDTSTVAQAGGLWIFFGGPNGLRTDNVETIGLGDTVFASSSGPTYLGEATAAGDFNGDGVDDLAFGMGVIDHVLVAHGSATGLDKGLSQDMLQPGSSGVPASISTFGFSLSAGDINGDGISDLAVGSPYDYEDKGFSAGSVAVIYGSKSGWRQVTGAQRFTPDTTGVPGSIHTFTTDMPDSFGYQVQLADFNGDGKADLAVSAPGTPVTTTDKVKHEDAGTVTVLYSNGTSIGTTNAVVVDQSTTGMPGSPGKNDLAGYTMASGDANGDGRADLAVYSPGDTYVTVVVGASAGLSFATAKAWTQNTTGIPGTTEAGDAWGDSLRFENFKAGSGPQGLAVGADGENNGAGAVTMIYSTSGGLTATGSVAFSQNSTGVPGTSEAGDLFGGMFPW